MDLSKLWVFSSVAKERNITKAAKKLNLPQSTVSRSVMEFEKGLKIQLFERHKMGVNLTAQGERIFEFAKKILRDTDLFEKILYEQVDEIQGKLKISTNPFLGSEWVIPNLKGFLKLYKNLKVEVIFEEENLDLFDSDIIVRTFMQNHPNLIQKHLKTFQMKVFASKEYLKEFGTPQTPEDLDHHRLITYGGDIISTLGNANWLLYLGKKDNQLPRESYLTINSITGLFQSALNGLGIVTLPNIPFILESKLEEIFFEINCPEISIFFIFPKERLNSKKINLFCQYFEKK